MANHPFRETCFELPGELHLMLDVLDESKRQLARLRNIFGSSCEEYEELKEDIERSESAKGR